jgi:hypothetical protein
MMKQYGSRISWLALALCFCLGSLDILPVLNVVGLSVAEICEMGSQNNDSLDAGELDEEFVIVNLVTTLVDRFFLPSRPIRLDFQAARLSPVSPPPKDS